jgi:trimethylamine-N-oxide reductase (cytochrome c)
MTNNFSRRDILKMAAIGSLYSALCPNKVFAYSNEQTILHATHFGPINAVVKNGKIIKTSMHPEVRFDTDMARSLVNYVDAPNRIKTPCVRKSFLEGRKQPELRGAEPFISISWEDVIDLVADKLLQAKQSYGNESILRTSFAGWSNAGAITRPNIIQGRFLGLFGGYTDTINDYSAGASTQIMPYVLGKMEVYSKQTSYEVIAKNTRTIVLWGTDPLKSFLIDYFIPDFQRLHWFRKFKAQGVKFICIDPVYNDTAKEFEAEWVPVRPGTDVAMILGMCHYLYTSGKYDKTFIEKYTVGFGAFRDYLLGKTDGVPKSLSWAENICGISAKRCMALVDILNREDTLISTFFGPQRAEHGEQFHWSLVVLSAMLGNIGKPGSGVHFGVGLHGLTRNIPSRLSQGRNPTKAFIPASRLGEVLHNPGKSIDFNGMKIIFPNIKLIHNMGANPMTHHQNINSLLTGLLKVDTIITHEIFWTPWAKYSDIVLPSTTTFERNDIDFSYLDNVTYIWAIKQVVKPMYEAKDDYWILEQLSDKMGFSKKFTMGKSIMDWVRWSYEGVGANIPFEEFWRRGFIRFIKTDIDRNYVNFASFIQNPQNNPLMTPSGKIEIYSEKVASFGYKDCAGHPKWYSPEEWLGSPKVKKHRFHLLSIHSKYRLHSQLDNLPLAKKYKVDGREPVWINPIDARILGIKDGDLVEVYNDRGAIVCGAVLSSRIIRSVVRVDEGAWYAPEQPGKIGTRCISGDVNVLTSDKPTSRLAQACAAHSCLVSIRKVTGKIKENTAYNNPEIIEKGKKKF